MLQSRIEISLEQKRKIVENGMELSRVQKFIDVMNKISVKEILMFINVKDSSMYEGIGIEDNETHQLLLVDGKLEADLKFTKDELSYTEDHLLKDYFTFTRTQWADVLLLEMRRKDD